MGQESMKGVGVNPSYSYYSQGNPSQVIFKSLLIANPMRTLLPWTAQAALHAFSSSGKIPTQGAW